MKKHMVAAILVALPFIAGCQQRTDFDACVEYYEQNIRGKGRPQLSSDRGTDLKPDEIWLHCKPWGR